MQQKPENNLKEYTEFLDCPQHNQKESTSNNSNTKTNKKDGEPEIKDEEKKKLKLHNNLILNKRYSQYN